MAEKINEREMWEKIVDKFRKRSLWMLHYCTGCGAVELPPTMTSRYDMSRFGISPMVTPRQADILLITGYLSIKTLKRVVLIYEQMQAPKYVVGFGSCTINGGMYWNSYATMKQLDRYIPVDLYIAGCMPQPEAVITAFNELARRIDTGEANAWRKYYENYHWYKKNQFDLMGEFDTNVDVLAEAEKYGIKVKEAEK
jgi:NADH-quinone oxidoreductase subunit B